MFRFIKKLKEKIKLMNVLQPGDLVWSKMPLSRKELKKIEKEHQVRPYLVVDKSLFFIYAYQSSSKQSSTLNNCQEYRINKYRYKKSKDSYLNLTKVYKIPFYKLKKKHNTLNEVDLKNIQKRFKVNKSSYKLIENIYISEGDVIESENQFYYVYSTDNVYVYCFLIFKKYPNTGERYEKITINNKTYYTNFKVKKYFNRKENLNIVNIAYNMEIDEILEQKKGMKQKELSNIQKKEHIKNNNKMTYESGTIFQVGNNKMVYLFKANNKYYGVNALMYKIKPRVVPIYNIHKSQILGIVPKEDYLKMVECLYLNNVQPLKEIGDLYDDLRNMVYSLV